MARLRWPLLLVAILLGLGAVPVHAADEGLPALARLHTVREQTVLLFEGRPLQVCQREWQSWNRVHGVCHELVTASVYDQQLVAGRVIEFVLFDGRRYEREGSATNWSEGADEGFTPDVPLEEALFAIDEEAVVTAIGPAEVAGTVTTQYQLWVTDTVANEAAGGQLVYDQFISSAGYVLKSQQRVSGAIPGLGVGALTEIRSYRDFNGAITVGAPGG